MSFSPLLLFCLKSQLYFGIVSAGILALSSHLLGMGGSGYRFGLAAIIAVLYSILVFFAQRAVKSKSDVAKILVLLVSILNGVSALAMIIELPAELSSSALVRNASQICLIWLMGLTAIICLNSFLSKETVSTRAEPPKEGAPGDK